MPKQLIRELSFSLLILLILGCRQNARTDQAKISPQTPISEDEISSARIAVDVGVLVADMEKSLGFYRDLIGLSFVTEINTTLIGTGRMVQLKHGESLIKLVEMDQKPSLPSPEEISSALGYRYITLMVPEMDSIKAKIEQASVEVKLPLTELGNGAKILMVKDPDGNIVEFVQEVTN